MILVNLDIHDRLFFWPTDGTYTAVYVNIYTEKGEVTVDEILTAASDLTFDLENGNTLELHEKYNISVAKINGKYIWILNMQNFYFWKGWCLKISTCLCVC